MQNLFFINYKTSRVIIILILFLVIRTDIVSHNSEEHKLITDKGVSSVMIPSTIKLPEFLKFENVSKDKYLSVYKFGKMLAVGFQTNNQNDYNKYAPGVQDNCYYYNFGQLEYNKNIWIPEEQNLPEKVLYIPAYLGAQLKLFTFGELVSLYGDYRRTTYSDSEGNCFLTDGNIDVIRFDKGNVFDKEKYCPKPVGSERYLQSIASGVVPPFGSLGNTTRNTAADDEYDEAGWWGDEMLRIANVNDWHFSNVGLAWYIGMHRLALYYVNKAREDSKYWIKALHCEANALHSLTDLFAFGHVVTNRGQTSYEMMKANNLLNEKAYQWMEHVIRLGGGTRNNDGKVELSDKLPEITTVSDIRNDFLKSYRKTLQLIRQANTEREYHDKYNESGAQVRNLNNTVFYIYGDGKLHDLEQNARDAISNAVRSSVQSLFDAYVILENGRATVKEIGSAGSNYFAALKFVPVYVDREPTNFINKKWVLYAKAADEISGAGIVPDDWEKNKIPFLSGVK